MSESADLFDEIHAAAIEIDLYRDLVAGWREELVRRQNQIEAMYHWKKERDNLFEELGLVSEQRDKLAARLYAELARPSSARREAEKKVIEASEFLRDELNRIAPMIIRSPGYKALDSRLAALAALGQEG